MEYKPKVVLNNTNRKENIPPTLKKTTLQSITDTDNKEKHKNNWYSAVKEKLAATLLIEVITTSTEGKNIVEPNINDKSINLETN
ncbi:16801_t:CDS:2 [Gigaspora margarita]|uniref:16801_t:CDS:1 n=1 Tax=Gigaspora margarita TaxID=4874 RepID=A0ABN7V229_GIGMA|nr:16801_t:CDS:2 [Gigaspora margarita]